MKQIAPSNPVRVALILNDLGLVLTSADKSVSAVNNLRNRHGN